MELLPQVTDNGMQDLNYTKVPFRVLRHFTHKASVTSVYAEANVHSADWLMRVFINELAPPPCTQLTRSVRAVVPKDYERDFNATMAMSSGARPLVPFYSKAFYSTCSGIK